MKLKKILLSSIIIWIVSAVFGFITCGYLFNWVYQLPPNIWKSAEIMAGNLVWMNLIGLFTATIFVLVFAILYKGIPRKGMKKGIVYGFFVWLLIAVSGMITMPFYMTISPVVVAYWIIQALVLNIIIGAILGAIYKE
ncbi:hypothetical protein KAJ87_00545 [Candidatus Pacearchaeota archaeon]|nr:hypothetical protein [Candidatus Pacearchaeota archaeon]